MEIYSALGASSQTASAKVGSIWAYLASDGPKLELVVAALRATSQVKLSADSNSDLCACYPPASTSLERRSPAKRIIIALVG